MQIILQVFLPIRKKYAKGIELWKKQKGDFSFNYINSMLADSDTDYCSITVK